MSDKVYLKFVIHYPVLPTKHYLCGLKSLHIHLHQVVGEIY